MPDDVVVGFVFEILVSEDAEHAFDGNARCIHREWIALKPPQLVRITHALESGAAIVIGRRCHHMSIVGDCSHRHRLDSTAEERATWELIKDVEIRLRKLVSTRYGGRWDTRCESQIRKVLGEDTWKTIEKNRDKHVAQYGQVPADDSGVLQYTCLGQLAQLMVANESWELFKPMFRDRRELEDLMRRITGVRNDAAHFRAVPPAQLRSCQVACDELKALLLKAQAQS